MTEAEILAAIAECDRVLELSQPPSIEDIAATIAGAGFHRRDHLDALAQKLESAVQDAENGLSRRLVVSMPPGLGKSVSCSVALPVHALARNPQWNVAIASAEASLAQKFSRDARRTAQDLNLLELSEDSRAVTEWETRQGGGMVARGVGGMLTGRRVTLMVIDDPVRDARAANSPAEREALWDWWQSVARTRLAPASVAVLVMTRWHEDDLAARLLAQGWEEFRLPALAEVDDPLQREVGAPLLSPQADETAEQALQRWAGVAEEVGSFAWAGLYQQRPAPAGGSIFGEGWIEALDSPVDLEAGTWVTSWDLSFGATGDYMVGTVWQSVPNGAYVLHDLIRGRWEFPDQVRQIRRTAERYPRCSHHLVEDAANGRAAIDTLKREIPGITPIRPLGGKVERAQAVTPLLEAKKVFHVGGAWLSDLLTELMTFPNAAHDDQVDSLTQALNWLRVRRFGPAKVSDHVASTLPGW